MFTCNGTLNSVTIPYSTIQGIPWDDKLSLELAVWRRQNEGGYSQEGVNLQLPDVTIGNESATENVKGNATLQSAINIQKYDILQFIVRRHGGGDKREHVPFLLTENQQRCTPPGCPLVPIIHVEFSSSEPVQGRPHKQRDKYTLQHIRQQMKSGSSLFQSCTLLNIPTLYIEQT